MSPVSMMPVLDWKIHEENDDCVRDIKLVKQGKRREVASGTAIGEIDKDYECFLNRIGVNCYDRNFQAQCMKCSVDYSKVQYVSKHNVLDPEYKTFSQRLRGDKKSSSLKFVKNDGTPVLVQYEKEDGLCAGDNSEMNLKKLRNSSTWEHRGTLKCTDRRKAGSREIWNNSMRETTITPKNMSYGSRMGEIAHPKYVQPKEEMKSKMVNKSYVELDGDPQYEIYLETLRKDKKRYALEFVANDETSVLIQYEKEDGICAGLNSEKILKSLRNYSMGEHRKTEQCTTERTAGRGRIFYDATRENTNVRNSLGRMQPPKYVEREELRTSKMVQKLDVELVEDPQYKMFLENLRQDKKSYEPEFVENDGMPVLIKYEKEDGLCDGLNLDRWRKSLRITSKRGYIESEKCTDKRKIKRSGILNNSERERTESRSPLRKKTPTRVRQKRKPKMDNKADAKHVDPISYPPSRKSPCPELCLLADRECRGEPKYNTVDECYEVPLNAVKNESVSVLTQGSGRQLKSDKMMTSSNSDVIVMDYDSFPNPNDSPFITARSDMRNMDLDCRRSTKGSGTEANPSRFKEKLMDILQRPYDRKELKTRWREVSCRRPVETVEILHGGKETTYTLGCLGKSYLDHYTELKAKMKTVQNNRPKVLNLLRGFFYYLEYVAQEGSFMPWKDSACSKVLPSA